MIKINKKFLGRPFPRKRTMANSAKFNSIQLSPKYPGTIKSAFRLCELMTINLSSVFAKLTQQGLSLKRFIREILR